jgi:RNA polymerase sigma factor (sigma-70 family)
MRIVKNIQEKSGEFALWQRFRAGEESALEQLMLDNFQLLFRYGTKYSRNDAYIKDCIQDLFLELWNRKQFLSEDISIKPYLMASLRRRLHRGLSSQKWISPDAVDLDNSCFEVEFSVEDSLIREETTQAIAYEIKAHLDQLPKRQKEVVYLKFYEDLSRDEIAQVMGIHAQSVSNLLQAAFKQLKIGWKIELFLLFLLGILY